MRAAKASAIPIACTVPGTAGNLAAGATLTLETAIGGVPGSGIATAIAGGT